MAHSRFIQLFRKRFSEKLCTRQSRKVLWDMINALSVTLWLSNLRLLLSFSTRKHTSTASRVILWNFFEKQWTQDQSRALFPTTFLEIAVYGCTFYRNFFGLTRMQIAKIVNSYVSKHSPVPCRDMSLLKGCTTKGYRKDKKKTISNKAEHYSNLFTSSITITISFILMETAIVITTGCSTEYPTQRGGGGTKY